MKTQRYVKTSAILLVLMFIAVFGIASSADAQKVHALLVIMDDDLDIRQIVDANRLRVKKMLQLLDVTPEIWQADEQQIQPHHISEWVRNRQVNVEDTIFVYYSGHGHIDRKERHYLDLDMQNATSSLLRSDLVEEVLEKRCRLKMLITDTCSNRVQTSPPIAQSAGAVVSRKRRYTQDLFLKHKGFLDITAASPGQYAWGNNEIGGYFTAALIESFTTSSDTDEDGFLSWQEVFSATQDETGRLFSETTFLSIDKRKMNAIGQETQTPLKKDPLPVRLTQADTTLIVTSTPSGADVYVEGTRLGKTPIQKYKIDMGKNKEVYVTLGLILTGYKSKLRFVKFERGKAINVNFHLGKLADNSLVAQTVFWPEMIRVASGEFQMGSNDTEGDNDEQPVHTVYINEFYIDKYEVTNAQYKAFVDANPQWRKDRIPKEYHNGYYLWFWNGDDYPKGEADYPVVCVCWYAAMAYAKWAGKRLPTEAEWEKAARGGLIGQKYPWGDIIDEDGSANYNKPMRDTPLTMPVGKYPSNGYGLYDMGGNVSEWCLDAWNSDFYAVSPRRNPISGESIIKVTNKSTDVKSSRVVRGGSWMSGTKTVRVASRQKIDPTDVYHFIGFRCARDVDFKQ